MRRIFVDVLGEENSAKAQFHNVLLNLGRERSRAASLFPTGLEFNELSQRGHIQVNFEADRHLIVVDPMNERSVRDVDLYVAELFRVTPAQLIVKGQIVATGQVTPSVFLPYLVILKRDIKTFDLSRADLGALQHNLELLRRVAKNNRWFADVYEVNATDEAELGLFLSSVKQGRLASDHFEEQSKLGGTCCIDDNAIEMKDLGPHSYTDLFDQAEMRWQKYSADAQLKFVEADELKAIFTAAKANFVDSGNRFRVFSPTWTPGDDDQDPRVGASCNVVT